MTSHDDELAEVAYQALALRIEGRTAEAAQMLMRFFQVANTETVFDLCCEFAEEGRKALVKTAGAHAPIFENGEQWIINETTPDALDDPVTAFSVRFLVAYANGHEDTARAHYNALLLTAQDIRVKSVTRLFADIAVLCQEAAQPEDEGG